MSETTTELPTHEVLLTDVAGVKNKAGDVITQMTPEEVLSLIEDGTISGGMPLPVSEISIRM